MGNIFGSNELVQVLNICDTPQDTSEYFAVFMVEGSSCQGTGCQFYDFHEATLLFHMPQLLDKRCECRQKFTPFNKAEGIVLLFSRKLLNCSEHLLIPVFFSFFKYNKNEALHVSQREKEILRRELNSIKEETVWNLDKYSCKLIARKIEVFLTYCKRFYDRQFQTRSEQCTCVMKKLERHVDVYITNAHSATANTMAFHYISEQMQMSEAYLADYILFSKGYTLQELLKMRQLALAQKRISDTNGSLKTIAKELGFKSSQYMEDMFQQVYGFNIRECRYTS